MTHDIATKDAQHALYVVAGDYGLGLQPGSFTTHLIQAIQHADAFNRALVGQAFPSLVQAVRMASGSVEALEALRSIVKDRTESVSR
jgi:hypothetical protein